MEYLQIIIPSTITLVGFFVTYWLGKKHSESTKKTEFYLKKMDEILSELDYITTLTLKMIITQSTEEERNCITKLNQNVNSKVLCYGSKNALSILKEIDSWIYKKLYNTDNVEVMPEQHLAGYVLLLMQIKYDITGIKCSPHFWYIGVLTSSKDFEKICDSLCKYNNEMVRKLNLKRYLNVDLQVLKRPME